MARVFAKWSNVPRLPESLHDIHISCGVGDDQALGFDLNDEAATLTAIGKSPARRYRVGLRRPRAFGFPLA